MSSIIPYDSAEFKQSDIIMLDTCFLLNYFGFNQALFIERQCKDLIQNGANNGAMFVLSVKTIEELRNVIIRDTFKQNSTVQGSDQQAEKELKKSNLTLYKAIIGQAQSKIANYFEKINNEPAIFPEAVGVIDNQLLEVSYQLESKYSFPRPADSEQVALALQSEVPYIATNDEDFNNVNEAGLNILVDACQYRKYLNFQNTNT
jgi:hypothetical protein